MTKAMPKIPKGANVIKPQPGPQTQFLTCPADIIFFGGSAGGGKTFGLLMDDLYNINNPKFGSVIFRRTTSEITKEGALWDTACDLYLPLGAIPIQSPHYHFNWQSGAKISFHHMEQEKHRFSWQGSQIPSIKFDEITHFTWRQFNYMLSRLRSGSGVRGTIKATCNPDPDHFVRQWVDWYIGEDGFAIPERSGIIRWFIVENDEVIWASTKEELQKRYPKSLPKSFTFIRSSVFDNKILLEQDPNYLSNLQALTRVERARLLEGNWNIRPTAGSYFQRGDFEIVDAAPSGCQKVRAWDLAGTDRDTSDKQYKKEGNQAYTAGVLMSKDKNGVFYIEDVVRDHIDASKVIFYIKNIASQDDKKTIIRLPQDPGQAGKSQIKAFIKELAGYKVKSYPVSGSKEARATPLASQTQAGNVKLVRGKWNEAFINEAINFPDGAIKDQVDAAADAFDELVAAKKRAGAW